MVYACIAAGFSQNPDQKKDPSVNRNMGLEISAGYSMPLGTYASSDRNDKKSGYATGGWLIQATFDWMGKKDFGMAVQYSYQKNTVKNMSNLVYPYGIPDSVGSGAWSNHYLLLGPVFMKKIKRLRINAGIMGGVMVSSSSNFTTLNPTDTTGMKTNTNVGTGFAYEISVGIGYAVSSHITFSFTLNLLGGWPGITRQYQSQLIGYVTYKDPVTGIEYLKPVYSAPVEYEIKKVVTTLNPSIGLVYRF